MKRNPRVAVVALVCGMASYIDAAAIVSFGSAMVIYQRALGLDGAGVGLASGALTLGIAVGALAGGRLGDRWGRRPVFTVTMVAIVAATAMLALAGGLWAILVGALLLGLATGADLPVSLATISEASTDANRGRMLGLSQILWFVGIVAAMALGVFFGDAGRIGAQILFAHVGVVAVAVMFARLAIPESSEWSAARVGMATGTAGVQAKDLLKRPHAVPFIALLIFYAATNLAANTMGQFGTYLLVNVAGLQVSQASVVALALLPLGILGTIWFMAIADGRLRFAYFCVGAVLVVVGNLVPVIFGFSIASYVGSRVLAMGGAAFAGEAIMKLWTQESFPPLLRATAQGAVISAARFVAAAAAVVTPQLIALGTGVLYGVLTVVSALGVGTAWVVFRRRRSARPAQPVASESLR